MTLGAKKRTMLGARARTILGARARTILGARARTGATACVALVAGLLLTFERGPLAKDVRMATVAAVAGQPITAADLAAYWFARYPEEYGRTLRALIDERMVYLEAGQFGLQVPAPILAAAVRAEVDARRTQLRKLFGDKTDLAQEVQKAYRVDVATWQTKILRPRMHSQLLLERVVRWDTRRRTRVHVRIIVRNDAESAQSIAARVRQGADFGLTAGKHSEDPTARAGGDLPWIAKGDLAFPLVETRLFAAQRGAIVGPLSVTVDGATQWHLYKVIRHLPAWPKGPQSVARLESDLRDRPFSRGEYERWRARATVTHETQQFQPGG